MSFEFHPKSITNKLMYCRLFCYSCYMTLKLFKCLCYNQHVKIYKFNVNILWLSVYQQIMIAKNLHFIIKVLGMWSKQSVGSFKKVFHKFWLKILSKLFQSVNCLSKCLLQLEKKKRQHKHFMCSYSIILQIFNLYDVIFFVVYSTILCFIRTVYGFIGFSVNCSVLTESRILTNQQWGARLCVIASLPAAPQNTILCLVCGLSSSAAIMGRMHAPG